MTDDRSLREKLIELGIIRPSSEPVRTFQYGGREITERPFMAEDTLARYRARLIKHGFLIPKPRYRVLSIDTGMEWENG